VLNSFSLLKAAAPLFYGIFLGASFRAIAVNSLADRSLHLLDRVYLGGNVHRFYQFAMSIATILFGTGPYDVRGFDLNSIGTRAEGSCLGGSVGYAATFHAYRPLVPREMVTSLIFLLLMPI